MGASESRAREENGETGESSDTSLANESSGTALAAGVIAGAALLALGMGVGVVSLMGDSSKSSEEKTMKALGRDMRIPQRQFEESPLTYFRDLRNDSSKSGKEKTMKAPGRDMHIPQRTFEGSPHTYFEDLRRDQRKKSLATNESSGTALANESSGTAPAEGAIAGAVLLALGAGMVSLMGDSSKSSEEKTMKAPGRDMRIPRGQFEESPVTYFRNLRSDQRKK